MKKISCLVFVVAVVTSILVGCEGYDKNPVPTINTQNTEMLKEKYIDPIVNSGVQGDWEDTEDIDPYHNLLDFYLYSGNLYDYEDTCDNCFAACHYYNQDKVESFIMQYFDANIEKLRKTDYYYEDKEAYLLRGIGSGEVPTKITGAKQEDDILTINYEISDIKGEVFLIGEANIKLIDKNNYKYISCGLRNLDMEKAKQNRR